MEAAVAVQERPIRFSHVKGAELITIFGQSSQYIEGRKGIYTEHWKEVSVHKEMLILKPNYKQYMDMIEDDSLVAIAAYDGNELVGYCLFITFHHLHYKDVLVANDDMYFIKPDYRNRGLGTVMVKFAESVLKERGVKFVQVRTKAHTPHEQFLKAMGYGPMDLCYCKVLEN